jgi:hypothetical protein
MSTITTSKNFSNEEAKAVLRERILNSLNDLTVLSKNIVKSSKTTELFQHSFKTFSSTDSNIDNTGDKLNKINIITTQLNFQAEAIEADCKLFKEIQNQIGSILSK